jgi:hypothetical protein
VKLKLENKIERNQPKVVKFNVFNRVEYKLPESGKASFQELLV